MPKVKKPEVVVIMPAYNAATTLEKTYRDIPKGLASEVILVDDGSHDETVKIAKRLGLTIFVHQHNLGYGANQKTCYWEALKRKPDIVVMVHPDYQYDSSLTDDLIKPIIENRFDIMLGSRIRSRKEALAGGMPLYKYLGNRLLTFIENLVLGLNLSEYHTGFRAFSGRALARIPFQRFSNGFVFDQEILIYAAGRNLKIGEIAVPVRYFPEASTIDLKGSLVYGLSTLLVLVKHRLGLQR
jgi:glycosyltransferase involved in cell wall biosynthesis